MPDTLKIGFTPFGRVKGVLVMFCPEGLKFGSASQKALLPIGDLFRRAAAADHFTGKSGSLDILAPSGLNVSRLVVVGTGKERDLKDRDMLEDTLVIFCGEFGRTSYCEGPMSFANYGRDHQQLCGGLLLIGGGFRGAPISSGFRGGMVGRSGLGFRGPVIGSGVRVAGFRGGGWRRGWGGWGWPVAAGLGLA